MTVRHYLEMLRGALAVLCVGLLCLVVVFVFFVAHLVWRGFNLPAKLLNRSSSWTGR